MTTSETRGYSADKDQLLNRLRRIEGQTRGIQKMVDERRDCEAVLTHAAQSVTEQLGTPPERTVVFPEAADPFPALTHRVWRTPTHAPSCSSARWPRGWPTTRPIST